MAANNVRKGRNRKAPEQTLEELLQNNGLDDAYWGPLLRDVGITSEKQLKHLDDNFLREFFKKHERYEWEGNALKACLPLSEEEKQNMIEKNEAKTKERQEIIEKNEGKINDILKKLDDVTDEKERMDRMRFDFQSPTGQKDLHKELTRMEFLQNKLVDRKMPSWTDLVTKISSSRVLRGYYIQKKLWERVLPRRQIIDIPGDVEVLAPILKETYSTLEFFSEEQSLRHDHVVNHWGFNAAANVGVMGLFTADIGISHKETEDESNEKQYEEGYTEIKTTSYVPLASFSLENVHHSISKNALTDLVELEKKLTDENQAVLCREFFETYGTHYYAGTYHFGGRYTLHVICRSKKEMSRSDSLKLSKFAIQGGVGGFFADLMGGFRVEGESSKDESVSKYREHDDYRVEKKIVKCGGPVEVDSVPQWKLGLAEYPSTWTVIDQDVYKNEWKGVWELLTDEHSSRFKDINLVRFALESEWEVEFKDRMEILKSKMEEQNSIFE
ncbi:interferon-induced very large GTPase 1-like [Saccostrea cucullata]|uniref:interferon-induced very large GTPase 1-like n=1 Tax=Saccostrea cuccullata TaxID=36930 RepID=UPI002ED29919